MMTAIAQSTKGEFRQVAIQPLSLLPGDIVQQVGNQLIVTRNGQVVATRDLTAESTSAPLTIQDAQTVSRALFFKEYAVTGIVATMGPPRRSETGELTFPFTDGSQRTFASAAEAISETNYLHTDVKTVQDFLIAKALALSPDGTNLHQVSGLKCSCDILASQPLTMDTP